MHGQYYLHTNGSLIHKTLPIDDPDSTFIIKIWNDDVIGKSPETLFHFLIEAYKLGAKKAEILRIADKNMLDKWIPDWKRIY